MYDIIGGDNQEYGPIDASEIKEWILDGRVDENTKIRIDKGAWQKVGDLEEFQEALKLPTQEESPATVTTSSSPAESLIGDKTSYNENYKVSPGGILRATFTLFYSSSRKFWISVGSVIVLLGISSLFGMIQKVISKPLLAILLHLPTSDNPLDYLKAIHSALESSPQVNLIYLLGGLYLFVELVSIALNGILTGGLFKFFISLNRGEKVDLSLCFAGFGKKWLSLCIAPFVVALLLLFSALPLGFSIGTILLMSNTLSQWMTLALSIVAVISFVPVMYLSACVFLTMPLIIDRELGCWDAIKLSLKAVSKQWILVLLVSIFLGILSVLGVFIFFIGIVLTMPLSYIGTAILYDEIFGKKS